MTKLQMVRNLAPVLAVDVALPYLVYLGAGAAGCSDVVALAWSALPPVLNLAWQGWRTRRLNVVGVFVLASIAVGVGASLMAGNPQLAVARDALPNIATGVALAVSLVVGSRPLVFHVLRALGGSYRPEVRERMDEQWTVNERFRTVLRRATAIGSVALLGEAAFRFAVAYTLPVGVAMPLLQIQSFVFWAGLILLMRRAAVRAMRDAAPAGDEVSAVRPAAAMPR